MNTANERLRELLEREGYYSWDSAEGN